MKTCFFIGHRSAPESIFSRLEAAVERHISDYGVTDFVVGKYGAFDRMAAQAVIHAKQRHPEATLTRLLAYYNFKSEPLPEGFDGSIFPEGLETVPRRAAIPRANLYMLRHCDYLIAYAPNRIGNAREFVAAARRIEGLRVENIAESVR